jgi:hypothetical protein
VLVTTGKEVVLDISLEQNIASLDEVVVKGGKTKKGNVSNEYAGSSGRSFNIEEVTRYAGGRNDPSKLVSNFAGVISNNDSRNDIVVRGNSPLACCGALKACHRQAQTTIQHWEQQADLYQP